MNTVKLTIFFAGGCPFCQREVDFLESRNHELALKFVDINSSDFPLENKYGITFKQAMRPNGKISIKIGFDHTKMKLSTSGIQFSPPKFPKYPKITPKKH